MVSRTFNIVVADECHSALEVVHFQNKLLLVKLNAGVLINRLIELDWQLGVHPDIGRAEHPNQFGTYTYVSLENHCFQLVNLGRLADQCS